MGKEITVDIKTYPTAAQKLREQKILIYVFGRRPKNVRPRELPVVSL